MSSEQDGDAQKLSEQMLRLTNELYSAASLVYTMHEDTPERLVSQRM